MENIHKYNIQTTHSVLIFVKEIPFDKARRKCYRLGTMIPFLKESIEKESIWQKFF